MDFVPVRFRACRSWSDGYEDEHPPSPATAAANAADPYATNPEHGQRPSTWEKNAEDEGSPLKRAATAPR